MTVTEGKTISEIARAVSVDRNTVYKYTQMTDFGKGILPSKEDLASLSRRMQSFPTDGSYNPTGVDLKQFDALMGRQV